ncbi:cellulase family glycosylhydrolase [Rhodococcoides kyotonense]|uniref:cellulase family glycosylhydrolase n=1 Tax=Rhodococcoides kyotonense TaxID=398843 RepID=UPI001FEACBF0|nr:cellulase family glycosylhydrolase [Rhodococcus kyotonensis]
MRFAVVVVALALTVTACTPEPTPVPAQDPVSVWNSVRLAINTASVDMPGTDVRRDITGARDAGFGAIRLVIPWSEPTEGTIDWSASDAKVDAATDNGLPILGVVTWAPTWAVPPDYAHTAHPAPTNPQRFAQFASAAASRYRDRITAWEVWNEPNIAASFGPSANPEQYCAILRETSTAIRAAAPNALVITGPTSPAVDSTNDLSPETFVEALYRCAGHHTFDAIAMHPYSTPNLLAQSISTHQIDAVRHVMERNNDADKQIWFTEFGAPSSENQAAILADGIKTLQSLPYAGPVFVFDYRDSLTGSDIPDFNYGLLRSDYSPKPAFDAVRNLPR